jgi:hypothetical protein
MAIGAGKLKSTKPQSILIRLIKGYGDHIMSNTIRRSLAAVFVIVAAQFGIGVSHASEQALQTELNGYIKTFSGNNFAEQRKAIEPLGWSGYSTPKLFDLIADKLSALQNADSKLDKERASWFAKALALSGNKKYQSLLQDTAENAAAKKLRKHAKIALERLSTYSAWNPVISAGLATSRLPLEEKRIRNMLAAKDLSLFRLGAKRVYHANSGNKDLVALVKKRLMQDYQSANSKESIDAMAWAIKVLAQSGDSAHIPELDEIIANAKEKKIKKYAKKYRSYF